MRIEGACEGILFLLLILRVPWIDYSTINRLMSKLSRFQVPSKMPSRSFIIVQIGLRLVLPQVQIFQYATPILLTFSLGFVLIIAHSSLNIKKMWTALPHPYCSTTILIMPPTLGKICFMLMVTLSLIQDLELYSNQAFSVNNIFSLYCKLENIFMRYMFFIILRRVKNSLKMLS